MDTAPSKDSKRDVIEAPDDSTLLGDDNFRHLAEALPEIVFTAGPDGTVDFFNTEWGLFGGIDADDPDYLSWEGRIHPDDLESVATSWGRAVAEGTVFEHDFRMRSATGEHEWFSTRAVPVRNSDEEIVKWYGVTANIDDQKKMEIQLRQISNQKDEFLAMLGHELRNPLAALSTSFDVLSRKGISDEQAEVSFALLGRQIAHLTRLVDDTLDVSRLTSGKLRLICCPLEINQLVADCCSDSSEAAKEKNIALSVTPYHEAVWVDGDDVRIAQCLTNLLSNSIKFTDPRGKIEASVTASEQNVTLTVRDTGIGMTDAELARIFEPFEQGSGAQQLSTAGLGLGLAVIQKLAELHHGSVEAMSAGPGCGTTFHLKLPRIPPPEASNKPSPDDLQKNTGMKKYRILLVEDNEGVALSLRMFFEIEGHTVQVTDDGDACLKVLDEFRPDILLSDLTLPGHLSGWDIAEKVSGSYPLASRPYLVAISGHTQPHHISKSHEAGFDEHLSKPSTPADLRSLLERASAELKKRFEARKAPTVKS